MTPADLTALAEPSTVTSDAIADVLEILARETAWLEREMDEILGARSALTPANVDRLVALGVRLRPAVLARERLTQLDSHTLQAGVARWLVRHPRAIR